MTVSSVPRPVTVHTVEKHPGTVDTIGVHTVGTASRMSYDVVHAECWADTSNHATPVLTPPASTGPKIDTSGSMLETSSPSARPASAVSSVKTTGRGSVVRARCPNRGDLSKAGAGTTICGEAVPTAV